MLFFLCHYSQPSSLLLELLGLLIGLSVEVCFSSFRVREARSFLCFWSMWFFSVCFMFKMIWKVLAFVCEWSIWKCLVVSGLTSVEQWGRTAIFVQASSSRQGESSRSSPRGFSSNTRSCRKIEFWEKNHLAQARWPRLSESSQNPQDLCLQSRLSESTHLAWARAPNLSEIWRRLHYFLTCLLLMVWLDGLL